MKLNLNNKLIVKKENERKSHETWKSNSIGWQFTTGKELKLNESAIDKSQRLYVPPPEACSWGSLTFSTGLLKFVSTLLNSIRNMAVEKSTWKVFKKTLINKWCRVPTAAFASREIYTSCIGDCSLQAWSRRKNSISNSRNISQIIMRSFLLIFPSTYFNRIFCNIDLKEVLTQKLFLWKKGRFYILFEESKGLTTREVRCILVCNKIFWSHLKHLIFLLELTRSHLPSFEVA